MFKILILEDNHMQRKNLSKMISQISDFYIVIEASSYEEGLRLAKENDINLFYIDITLADKSGLDFALEIREIEIYKLTWMVFITTHQKYLSEAFKKVHCYDYIIKPYDKDCIKQTTEILAKGTQHVKETAISSKKHITVSVKGIKLKIAVEEINFIEVFLRTCVIHTAAGNYEVNRIPLKQFKEMINDDDAIIQCHRSFLVNMNNIRQIDKVSSKAYFYNTDESALIGRSFRSALLDII